MGHVKNKINIYLARIIPAVAAAEAGVEQIPQILQVCYVLVILLNHTR